ncbi:MAG: DUF3899 domain-containing protein [Gammaproteobacteria bacterium]|nr:DUF3899 domain-containing protein [Gammaproteobacteria bacterium]
MEEKRTVKVYILKYSITVFICAFLTVLFLLLNNYFVKDTLVEKYRVLADAFTFSGLFTVLVGCLVFISNAGGLDAIGWMLKRLFKGLIPLANRTDQTYQEYKESRKRVSGYGFLFIVGGVFLVVGIVFIILFFKVYQ